VELEVRTTSFIIHPLQLFITSSVNGLNFVTNSESLRQNLMKSLGSVLFSFMYFSALHVPARAQAFIFHNQAEVKGLEGM